MLRTNLLICATSLLVSSACGSDLEPGSESGADDIAGESDAVGETEAGETEANETEAGEADTGEADTGESEAGCGDGDRDPGEACDDANLSSGDGCNTLCQIECGHVCPHEGQPCVPGFRAVQCSAGEGPLGDASAAANECWLASFAADGSSIELGWSPRIDGELRHLDGIFVGADDRLFGFAGNTEDVESGSRLVTIDAAFGVMTPLGPSLGVWITGAAMNDQGELWVTVFDTYERNQNTPIRIARVDPNLGMFVSEPTTLSEGGDLLHAYSIHGSDIAFRSDGAMVLSANAAAIDPDLNYPGSRYLEIDPQTASVLAAVEGPNDVVPAGLVFVGDAQRALVMDIGGDDDILALDLASPPPLDQTLLYADPIPTNSGTADLAGCAKLNPQ